MLILGIDPGTARMGLGVVEKNGHDPRFVFATCVETSMETSAGDRLMFLGDELSKILQKYNPDVACVEQLFFGINARTAIAVGQARGVILATLARHKVPQVLEYQGLSVKHALTGFGRADKKQMQEMVRVHLGLREVPKPDDCADALAAAITYALMSKV